MNHFVVIVLFIVLFTYVDFWPFFHFPFACLIILIMVILLCS